MLAAERETSIAYTDDDEVVHIYTCIRRDLSAMKKNPAFKVIRSGTYSDGTPWASFELSVEDFGSISSIVKRKRTLTDEQRAATAERLSKARKAK